MNKKTIWPKVSLVLLTFNGGIGVKKILESVKKQDYPKTKIEIIVMDNGSSDNSVKIAKQYTKKVYVDKRDVFEIRAEGMHKTTGEFIYMILEQDIEIRHKNFLKMMIRPMLKNQDIVASFTRKYPRSDQSWVTRFISYHPIQCDPLYAYLTYPIEKTFIKEKKGYILCKYELGKIPLMGRMFYRRKYLKNTPLWTSNSTSDPNEVRIVVKNGYRYFAYVPKAGLYHYHAKDLKQLIGKRIRNLHTHYFPHNNTIEYRYLDINKKQEILKMMLWIIYANLFIPALIKGSLRYLKHRDWALLMEPVITITTTDVILWHFLNHTIGRKMLFKGLNTLLYGNKPIKG